MKIVNSAEVQWHAGPGHREGGLLFRDLLTGEPGADNFWFVLARVEEHYDAPPHRHNFEQVRFLLEGAFDFGPKAQEAGSVGYFCEGTTYTQTARGPSLTLLLQCEGPSRSRYIGIPELVRSVHELRSAGGTFAAGRYRGPDGATTDGYQAAWENVVGEPLAYPEPRFDAPVIMHAAIFAEQPVDGQPGVFERHLGTFSERRIGLRFVRLDPLAKWSEHQVRRTLFYVLQGNGMFRDDGIEEGYAVQVEPGDGWRVQASEAGLVLYVVHLPR